MTIGDRIRVVRRYYQLNQTDFGKRVGLSQSAIGGYENNTHAVAEQTLIHICKEYRINEMWFRTGEGEMLSNNGEVFAAEMKEKYRLSDYQMALVRGVYEMPPELQRMAVEVARKIAADSYRNAEIDETEHERIERITNQYLDAHESQATTQQTDKKA